MKTKLLVVLCVVLGLSAEVLVAAVPASGAKNPDQAQKLANDYLATKVEKEKVADLEGLLKINSSDSHAYFYALLFKADTADLKSFQVATHNCGQVEMLINLSSFVKIIQDRFLDELKKTPDPTEKEIAELSDQLTAVVDEFMKKLEILSPDFAILAKKNSKVLIAEIERVSTGKRSDFVNSIGPMLGFLAMEEDGATLLLSSLDIKGKSGELFVSAANSFGPNIVIPAFKQFENPDSTQKQRDTAGTIIYSFANHEAVYDKVIEAYKHGRYFELKGGIKDKDGKVTVNVEDVKTAVKSWWGNHVEAVYRDNKKFFDYVAKTHLPKPDGQDEVIKLLASSNFGLAAPHLMKLDIATLSEKSLDMLLNFACVSLGELDIDEMLNRKSYLKEKFALYNKIFKILDPKKREAKNMVRSFANFPPEDRVVFVKDNIGNFTDDEKDSIVFLCDNPLKKTPKDTQQKIFDILRKGASKELLKTIEYVEKRKE